MAIYAQVVISMLSVIVKAFNEEKGIARCIESILHETGGMEREIIIVDSLSTDCTVAISKRYPVKVVQFINRHDCGCGSAPQLGYQVSKGDLICLIDGDMEMIPGFLNAAISYLADNISVAGVGGVLVDRSTKTVVEKTRSERYQKIKDILDVSSLGGGGVYRREAIARIGYFSHKGLKALEEMELGLRLLAAGWHLVRLPLPSVIHTGHDESYAQSMIRLLKNGRLAAYGVLLHSSWGRKWFIRTLLLNWFVAAPIVLIFMTVLTYCLVNNYSPLSVGLTESAFFVLTIVVAGLGIKKKSIKLSLLSIASWFIVTVASIPGLVKPVPDPNEPIRFRLL
ncbi:MAG: glycosyltransferase [Dehalococcoidia bacterium]|nr:MAG: glycosyltransferase [Dehalococcoidia bacterium]